MKPHLVLLACLLFPAAVLAGEAVPQESQAQESVARESVVKDWLELQSSGQAASAQPQPLSGAVMEQVHERYLKSFTAPIPSSYERAATGSK